MPSRDGCLPFAAEAEFGRVISYAQNFEDVLLARVFAGISQGFYVDVGAHDPEYLSITKTFYDQGWHGINLEPVPTAHRKFESLRPRDLNLAVAAGREEGEAQLFIPADPAFATLLEEVAEHSVTTLGDKTITAVQVRVRPLTAILDEHGVTHIDFLTIDVEGAERSVLEGLDLVRYRPVVIVCEATASGERLDFDAPESVFTHHQWEPLLTHAGYRCVFFDGLNRFYLRNESESLEPRFGIPVGPVRDNFRQAQDEIKAVATGRLATVTQELAAARDDVRRLTVGAETQHDRIRDLERSVEGLRYGLWARDHKLDELGGSSLRPSRNERASGRGS